MSTVYDDAHCWTEEVELGNNRQPMRMFIVKLRNEETAAKKMVFSQVCEAMETPDSSLRDVCRNHKYGLQKVDAPPVLKALKEVKAISKFASHVTLVNMSEVAWLWLRTSGWERAAMNLDALRANTTPPLSRHSIRADESNIGSTALLMRPPTASCLLASEMNTSVSGASRAVLRFGSYEAGPSGLQQQHSSHYHRQIPPLGLPLVLQPAAAIIEQQQPVAVGVVNKTYEFPATLPPMILPEAERRAPYAISTSEATRVLKREVTAYVAWAGAAINTERSTRYIGGVQTTTLDKVPNLIYAFLGYIRSYYRIPEEALSLDLFADPKYIARFMSYLRARGVRQGHITKQARKINDYLQSGAPMPSPVRDHAKRMEDWLGVLEGQIRRDMPNMAKTDMPDITISWSWAIRLGEVALQRVKEDLKDGSNQMGHRAAMLVQRALLASLITGAYAPACRLYILKTLGHPDYNFQMFCNDPDCREPRGECFGNRLDVIISSSNQDGPATAVVPPVWQRITSAEASIRLTIVHHKNDRRQQYEKCPPLTFTFPPGVLTMLFLAHIYQGQKVLTQPYGQMTSNLFVSGAGNAFSDQTFVHYWRTLMDNEDTLGQQYFAPSLARTMFIEEYTSEFGMPPEMYDGAASIMGNCVKQWHASYNPSRRKRAAQKAVDAHASFVQRRAIWASLDEAREQPREQEEEQAEEEGGAELDNFAEMMN
ncbi:hypothetical protein CEUSTIGMA_g10073.t1 [Chlamydomonas eustigma]|uniref:Uncharacterized protein n=1 Tax=Chlamydomonas eustigma TaxID=1157962 RepID=A0A250XHT6_9CHLO|nr:hypothetical protein CEUSTIGMA_g10073.t1 [Chlamydomonas eustigma]|eukprot:GAX82647.1 hypothetical protein CEUSTIGMA_g10073.t1 [Chlamydomonas eustigma]